MEKLVIVKLGGEVLSDASAFQAVIRKLALLPGKRILVHGGGKIADEIAEKLDIDSQFVDGRRKTSEQMRDVTMMVYGGLLNGRLVAELQKNGCCAAGLTGADGRLLCAEKRVSKIDFGYVGDITDVNPGILLRHLSMDIVPVVAPLTYNDRYGLLNTNADTIAATLARHFASSFQVQLLLCFGKSGVLRNALDETSLLVRLPRQRYYKLRAEKAVAAGMLPKLDNGFRALASGVAEVRILSWRDLAAAVNGKSVGTLLVNGE